MPVLPLRIVADASPVLDDLALLACALEFSPMFRQRLVELSPVGGDGGIDLAQLGPELVRVNLDIALAPAAGELRIRLESGDALAHLTRAVRAGEFDDLVVER